MFEARRVYERGPVRDRLHRARHAIDGVGGRAERERRRRRAAVRVILGDRVRAVPKRSVLLSARLAPRHDRRPAAGEWRRAELEVDRRHRRDPNWGANIVVADQSIDALFADESKDAPAKGRKVTLKSKQKGSFVVSGYEGAQIFYEKYLFAADHYVAFVATYAPSGKGWWDRAVEHMAASFHAC